MVVPSPLVPTKNNDLRATLAEALNHHHAISMWHLPGHHKNHLIVAHKKTTFPTTLLQVETLEPGFLLSHFDNTQKKIFLQATHYYQDETEPTMGIPQKTLSTKKEKLNFHLPLCALNSLTTQKKDYLKTIQRCLQHIHRNEIEKIVPARCKTICLPNSFDLFDYYTRLCNHFFHAFISLISVPTLGTWIGASPELLLHIENGIRFKTTALAGTQPVLLKEKHTPPVWHTKEREEQAWVSQYIVDQLHDLGIYHYQQQDPKTYQIGHLFHLKTDFEITQPSVNQKTTFGSDLLKCLHPTPAVCGVPVKKCLSLLTNYEKFDRQLYSGYLGPVNCENKTDLYVNLRCMQWNRNLGVLYAGAGITKHSLPEKEWEETEMKMNALYTILTD